MESLIARGIHENPLPMLKKQKIKQKIGQQQYGTQIVLLKLITIGTQKLNKLINWTKGF
jgi:hypothetical protein